MGEKNLPIKLVLQKASDTQKNQGGGNIKFFCDVTQELQDAMTEKLEGILSYYESVFQESDLIPAVGKITVRTEAIAKSHKPNDFCRNCPIIGNEDLGEIYIKVSKKGIEDTLKLIQNPPSERFRANMTAITDIEPITASEKISTDLRRISSEGYFDVVRKRIKIKLFDFDDDFDNIQLTEYVMRKISEFGFSDKHELITYGDRIKLIKLEVQSYDDIIKLAGINGVKSIDFFQEYSLTSILVRQYSIPYRSSKMGLYARVMPISPKYFPSRISDFGYGKSYISRCDPCVTFCLKTRVTSSSLH